MTRIERLRLGFPPHKTNHSIENNLRLACQCNVLGDLKLEKLAGMWGNLATAEEKHNDRHST